MEFDSSRRVGTPVIDDGQRMVAAKPFPLRQSNRYKEDWLQKLVAEHPAVLPLADIEPAFEDAVSVCRELPLPAGNLDNFLMTPRGDLVLVECKLWRNAEARRKVLIQVMDYAKDLQSLTYEGLEDAVRRARKSLRSELYEIVGSSLSEADFIDRTSRNLGMSRALLLVVGDGITEHVEQLTEFLQQHAGLHFTLGLVQLTPYELPDGRLMVVPSVPLRTTNIVRAIVSTRAGEVRIDRPAEGGDGVQPTTLTDEEFFEAIDSVKPGTSERLRQLIARGSDMGLTWAVRKHLTIRLPIEDLIVRPLVVAPDGSADTSYLSWNFDRVGDVVAHYQQALARRLPGGEYRPSAKGGSLRMRGRALTVWDVLDNADAWLEETRRFRASVIEVLQSE